MNQSTRDQLTPDALEQQESQSISQVFNPDEVDNLKKLLKNFTEQYVCDEHDEKIFFYCREENKFLCGIDLYTEQYDFKKVEKTLKHQIQDIFKTYLKTTQYLRDYLQRVQENIERVLNFEIRTASQLSEVLQRGELMMQLESIVRRNNKFYLNKHVQVVAQVNVEVQTWIPKELESLQEFSTSNIVTNSDDRNLISEYLPKDYLIGKLLYRQSTHGATPQIFHQLCDKAEGTITLVKSGDRIFGGLTMDRWNRGDKVYIPDKEAFLFSVSKKKKYLAKQDLYQQVYCKTEYGPTFGAGHDLTLRLGTPKSSYSNLGKSYICDFAEGSDEAKTELAGAYKFAIDDCEVFSVFKQPPQ